MKNRIKFIVWFSAFMGALLVVRLAVMWTTPVFDPSEARYAAISANMARTGDFLVPHFTYKGVYQPFNGKPPLVFQAGGMACRLFGVNEFAVRLFPFLSALMLLALLFRTVRRLKGTLAALMAVGICLTCTAFFAAIGFCMTDIPLTCCVAGALLLYAESAALGKLGWRSVLSMATLMGVGMLVKGPVTLVLVGLPVFVDAVLNGRWRFLSGGKCLCGIAIVLLISAPWFALMQMKDPDFLRYFFINENVLRFLTQDYGDRYGAGRQTFQGMAALHAFVVTLPWSFFPLLEIRHHVAMKRESLWGCFLLAMRRSFCLLSAVVITLFWCLTSRVPLAYLFPVIPLFSAWLAMRRRCFRFRWMFPFAAVASVAVLLGTILFTRCFTRKMQGADAPKRISGRHYSYEFYHGPWGCPEGRVK